MFRRCYTRCGGGSTGRRQLGDLGSGGGAGEGAEGPETGRWPFDGRAWGMGLGYVGVRYESQSARLCERLRKASPATAYAMKVAPPVRLGSPLRVLEAPAPQKKHISGPFFVIFKNVRKIKVIPRAG